MNKSKKNSSRWNKWPLNIVTVISASIIVMSFVWFFLISEVVIREKQIIESDAGNQFIAKCDSVDAIAVSRDTSFVTEYVENDVININILSQDTDESIWRDTFLTADVENNAFSEIAISNTIHLEKGKSYRVVYDEGNTSNKYSLMLIGNEISIFPYYFILCIFCVALLTVYLYWNEKVNAHFIICFMIAFLCLGALNTYVLKPLAVPDEESHFGKAYYLSNQMLGYEDDDRLKVTESGITRKFGDVSLENAVFFFSNLDYGNKKTARKTTWMNEGSNLSDLPYYPSAVGIAIGRIARLPYQWIVILGRLFNILFLLLMDAIAIRVYPKLRYVIAGVCLVPGMTWVLSSYSYDVWNLAWILLFLSLCMRVREEKSGVRVQDLVLMALSLIMFAPIKGIYVLLGFTIMLIPRSQWKDKRLVWGCAGIIVMACVFLVLARGQELYSMLTSDAMDPRGVVDESADSYTLRYIIRNPIAIFLTFIKTFIVTTEEFLYKSIGGEFYSGYVPSVLVAIGLLIVLLLVFIAVPEIIVEKKEKIISVAIIFIGCLSVYGSFLFIFSQIPQEGIGIIGGMQARYFIPFMVLLPFAVKNEQLEYISEKIVNSFNETRFSNGCHNTQETLLGMLFALNIAIAFCKWIGIALS